MKQHLLNRGYTNRCINDAINKAPITRERDKRGFSERKYQATKASKSSIPHQLQPNTTKHSQTAKKSHTVLEASEKCTEVFKNVPQVSYRRGRNLRDMLCSKRMPPQINADKENLNPDDHNKKEDESQLKLNQCPECGLFLKNEKGLKTSKHRRKQNATTSLQTL